LSPDAWAKHGTLAASSAAKPPYAIQPARSVLGMTDLFSGETRSVSLSELVENRAAMIAGGRSASSAAGRRSRSRTAAGHRRPVSGEHLSHQPHSNRLKAV
jgi:hypothetical protein